MSYNLFVEGADDYAALSALAARFPAFEMFPIPPDDVDDQPALGLALPSSRAAEGAEVAAELVRELLDRGLRVHDLYAGLELESDADLDELVERLAG